MNIGMTIHSRPTLPMPGKAAQFGRYIQQHFLQLLGQKLRRKS